MGKRMSAKDKAAYISAVAIVVAALIGAVALYLKDHYFESGKRFLSGIVTDAKTKAPLAGIVVRLEDADGRPTRQDTTDKDGGFSLEIPPNLETVRLKANAAGYYTYDRQLPAKAARNDIQLERQPIRFGIPDGMPLDKALDTVAAPLNITVVLSPGCSKRARSARVGSATLESDPSDPGALIRALLDRVEIQDIHYRVTALEGRRYEVSCH
jgi:hypothetical protein